MSELAVDSGTKFTVSQIARENANNFAKVINTSPRVASQKLRRFTKAIISKMEIGDEQRFPIPANQTRRSFVIKKTGYEEFVITVVIEASRKRSRARR